MALGDLIRRYRLAAGLSQEDLAERAGLSVRGISDLERGRRLSPHMETLRLLAEGLGLTDVERASLIEAARPELQAAPSPDSPTTAAPSSPPRTSHRSLPTPPTQLLGRDELVDQIAGHVLQEEIRLITLTGPGGVGKTRAGLEAARRLAPQFSDGVVFLDLSLLSSDHQFGPALLDALAFTGNQGADPVGQLIDLLSNASLLLILDNFEHMLESAVSVARVLAFCPGVSVLVTSRTRLRLRGELVITVPPLSLPERDLGWSGEIISPAVKLFVERARDASSNFVLDEQTIETVRDICRRLDGLPLAIELAASWLRVLTPGALLDQLNDHLPSLGGGARDAPERHQTLRHTLGWSLQMLGQDEQRLFRQISAFSGGAALDAIQATAIGSPWDQLQLLELLANLVDNSLIRQSMADDGSTRYTMLETIRAFGREQAMERGEELPLRSAHAAWIRALAEEAEVGLVGPHESVWRSRLTDEQANIRSALDWSIEQGDIDSGLRIAGAVWRFWSKRGALLEGCEWLSRVLALPGEPEPELKAKASQALANMSFDLGDYAEAQTRFETSLAIRRNLPDKSLVANALNGLGLVAFAQGDLHRAQELHRESLALSREAGSLIGIGNSLSNGADVEMALGNLAESRLLQEEGLAIRRELGDENSIGYSLYNLGVLARLEGRHEDALTLLLEAVELFRSAGDLYGQAYGYCDLGTVRALLGNPQQGSLEVLEALRLRIEIGDQRGMVDCTESAARIAAISGDVERAFRLVGAASSRRMLINAPRTPAEEQELQFWTAPLTTVSPDVTGLLEEGEALSLPQAVELAREVLDVAGGRLV
jgi:predicted ATPase/DNA-binding XRE family transcriptional regulator